MVGFCHLTDSHHYHHGQKPTMVGICHGGNMPVGQDNRRIRIVYLVLSYFASLIPEQTHSTIMGYQEFKLELPQVPRLRLKVYFVDKFEDLKFLL